MNDWKYKDNDAMNGKQMKTEAIKKVAVLVKELIGDRSIRRTGEEAGVAASYITGILKEKYLPSAEILKKLTLTSANPQNGVTLEDLMVAAGYQNNYSDEMAYPFFKREDIEIREQQTEDMALNRVNAYANAYANHIQNPELSRELERRERRRKIEKFENLSKGIIYKALSDKGISFSNANDVIGIRGFRPDIAIYLPKQPILEWWLDIKYIETDNFRDSRMFFSMFKTTLGQLMFIEPKFERKISIVIANKDIFYNLVMYKGKLSYRGDLSVILIDAEEFSVVSEVYLAHYKEQDTKSEFYII